MATNRDLRSDINELEEKQREFKKQVNSSNILSEKVDKLEAENKKLIKDLKESISNEKKLNRNDEDKICEYEVKEHMIRFWVLWEFQYIAE